MSSGTQPTAAAVPAAPVITRTEVTWLGERLFEAGPPGRTHRIDAAAKQAPGPVETLLNSLATCAGVDIVEIIAKRKTPVERMTVHVAGERRPQFPRRLQHVDIEYRIDGAGIERDHAERAIQLSFEAYCSVAASLAPDIVIDARLTLNGESFPAIRIKSWTPPA
ncbi:MAG TPA: OsmC family protein [Gemmatimonadaceae bacterium]|nr:OsmC family protein [Gemmatimonadaceae bacterium]